VANVYLLQAVHEVNLLQSGLPGAPFTTGTHRKRRKVMLARRKCMRKNLRSKSRWVEREELGACWRV
jgi:hypothetical protein